MWSLGTIIVELFLGLPLFPGTSEYNQLSRIIDMLGMPPPHLLEVGKQVNEFFNVAGVDQSGRKQYRLKSRDQFAAEHNTNEQPSKQYFKATKLPEIIKTYTLPKKVTRQADIDKGEVTVVRLESDRCADEESHRDEYKSLIHRLCQRTAQFGSDQALVASTCEAASLHHWRTVHRTIRCE